MATEGMPTCPTALPAFPTLPLPAVVPPPSSTCNTQPIASIPTGYMPFTITNNTGLSASDIYITVLVNSGKQYLSFATSGGTQGQGTITAFTDSTYLSSPFITGGVGSSPVYSYTLDQFPQVDSGTYPDNYTFYIPNTGNTADSGSPVMQSSRILISLKQPLTYFIDYTGSLQTPSEFQVTDDNYYVLNDKVEFDLGSNGHNRLNLNLTWVDFFGIPMLVQANYQYLYGTNYTPYCAVTGMPSSVSLADIFTQYNTALTSLNSPFDTYWSDLIATYTDPSSTFCKLRIYAPATAMGNTQYTQSNPSTISFPTNYFLSSAISDVACTWFDNVWSSTTGPSGSAYYQQTKPIPYLVVDATTTNGAGTATGYETNDGNFTFTVAAGKTNPDNAKTVIIPYPQSSKAFFTGAVSDYVPAITGTASSLAQAQIFKVFATSIIAGFFPINCQYPDPKNHNKKDTVTITSAYMQANCKNYFENNAILTSLLTGAACSCVSNSPWYDFYSRTLLTIGGGNLFYTSAYSDFLGADGTIVITDLAGKNADATVNVTLNNCSTSVNYPDLYSDSTSYQVFINPPFNKAGTQLATILYGTSISGPFNTYTNPITATGSEIFIKVTYTDSASPYNGKSYISQVAPQPKVYHPILPGQGNVSLTGSNTVTVGVGAPPET
jgi:hypothetical protein